MPNELSFASLKTLISDVEKEAAWYDLFDRIEEFLISIIDAQRTGTIGEFEELGLTELYFGIYKCLGLMSSIETNVDDETYEFGQAKQQLLTILRDVYQQYLEM